MAQILVVDDEESICWGIRKLGESLGYQVETCSTAEAGLDHATKTDPDLIVLDVRLPGMDGLTAMAQFQQHCPGTPIVVMTAYGVLDSAVAAIKNGAFEYLPKPFDSERVKTIIERALLVSQQNSKPADDPLPSDSDPPEIVGSCPPIQEVFRRIAYASTSDASVLITGESGTGKELAARSIHRHSSRCDGPFVPVNIAALSPSLAESELFGHVQGAFTGADRERIGLLAKANQGTLFLDEIAEVPLAVQVKLLRCLDQGEVLPIGSNQPVKTSFRMVSATHQNLSQAVADGRFRHDLFFRICAFQIELPPLRDRGDDQVLLAEFFVRQLSRNSDRIPVLDDSAQKEIRNRFWKGNVRELRNAIEHALILSRGGEITADHFPEPIEYGEPIESGDTQTEALAELDSLLASWTRSQISEGKDQEPLQNLYETFLQRVEPQFLKTVMENFDYQYVAASKALGIHRTTLKKKLTDHGIDKNP